MSRAYIEPCRSPDAFEGLCIHRVECHAMCRWALTKPLMIGEAPNRNGDVGPGRLAEYGARYDFKNLLTEWPGPNRNGGAIFPMSLARPAATNLHASLVVSRPFLLLGTRVPMAFGLNRLRYDYLEWFDYHGRKMAVVPHPSGLSRWWNSESNQLLVERFFKEMK